MTPTRGTPDRSSRAKTLELELEHQPAVHARRRQTRWIVAGALLVVGSALAFATVWSRASSGTRVLVLSRSVDAGHVLTSADLREVRVSADADVASVPATSEATVVGQTVASPLASGALLNPSDLASSSAVRAGQAIVGVALKPGMFPSGLAAGDHVRVVDTSGASSTGPTASRSAAGTTTGVVVDLGADASTGDGTTVVSLRVDDGAADDVAQLASGGHVSLVLIPAES